MKFTTNVQEYTSSADPIDSNCNDITFYNAGAATVFVDGFPILAGGVLAIEAKAGETNVTRYRVSFNGVAGSLFVIRKKYVVPGGKQ